MKCSEDYMSSNEHHDLENSHGQGTNESPKQIHTLRYICELDISLKGETLTLKVPR